MGGKYVVAEMSVGWGDQEEAGLAGWRVEEEKAALAEVAWALCGR